MQKTLHANDSPFFKGSPKPADIAKLDRLGTMVSTLARRMHSEVLPLAKKDVQGSFAIIKSVMEAFENAGLGPKEFFKAVRIVTTIEPMKKQDGTYPPILGFDVSSNYQILKEAISIAEQKEDYSGRLKVIVHTPEGDYAADFRVESIVADRLPRGPGTEGIIGAINSHKAENQDRLDALRGEIQALRAEIDALALSDPRVYLAYSLSMKGRNDDAAEINSYLASTLIEEERFSKKIVHAVRQAVPSGHVPTEELAGLFRRSYSPDTDFGTCVSIFISSVEKLNSERRAALRPPENGNGNGAKKVSINRGGCIAKMEKQVRTAIASDVKRLGMRDPFAHYAVKAHVERRGGVCSEIAARLFDAGMTDLSPGSPEHQHAIRKLVAELAAGNGAAPQGIAELHAMFRGNKGI